MGKKRREKDKPGSRDTGDIHKQCEDSDYGI